MRRETDTAAICGLYCGTCPSFEKECDGCLSERIAPGCDICGNGFRDCAKQHQVLRCNECAEFPCERLNNFSKKHIVNGICHHAHVIEDLHKMSEIGVESWVKNQKEQHTCKECGKIRYWYDSKCSNGCHQ